ncbi:MAG: formate--tetrahydrofolate ligase [Myxococcota bacterium]
MRPILDVASELGVKAEPWGPGRAKVDLSQIGAPKGRLVLVSAMTPTVAGEGKTTMAVALAMGMRRRGTRAVAVLRQPSMGPVFGKKGGGTGGGAAILEPSDDINLGLTGDFHAIAASHNLCAAMVDNRLYWGDGGFDARKVRWPRVLDVNDRALRHLVVGLDDGPAREARFDITAASEVMALFCLASGHEDLRARLGRVVVAERPDGTPVTAEDLHAAGAMATLLRDALMPNLVQTREGGPALVHGGPFANIAHGCNSALATRMGLTHGEVAITEAGFAMELGGEKFLDIKCRSAGVWPDAVVLVATSRALKQHGLANLDHHVALVQRFGLQPVVCLNRFPDDGPGEVAALARHCEARGAAFAPCDGYARGGEGSLDLADAVREVMRKGQPKHLYPLDAPVDRKLHAIATEAYGAEGVTFAPAAAKALEKLPTDTPVCVAKTQMSLRDDPKSTGPWKLHVRELRHYAGAGFVVALAGDIQTMPGLPKHPAAEGMG